jgi:hypothetical protein
MISHTNKFVTFWYALNSYDDGACEKIKLRGYGAQADKNFQADLTTVLVNLKNDCKKLQMDAVVKRIDQFLINLISPLLCTVISSEIKALMVMLQTEWMELKFAFIPKDAEIFFEREQLFGDAVYQAFPSARLHIKDGGNCLAADLNTAAVFHFMIVVEFGLRALAKHLKIKIKRDIQFADWDEVIRGIETKLSTIKHPRGKKRQAELEFYRPLLSECSEFKDVWRNNVMHARRRHNKFEALNVFNRVLAFMERLATRVSESS